MPIKNRLDMLATGIKTPVGIKLAGPDLGVIAELGRRIEGVLQNVPGTASVYAERVTGGRFIDIDVDREAAARFGLNIADVHDVVRTAIGGMSIGESIEGLERYPINLRYPADLRNSPQRLRMLPIMTMNGAEIPLGQVARIDVSEGPGLIRSENARLNGWIYVDVAGRDVSSYVDEARGIVAEAIDFPTGYSIIWSGQYEYMERAKQRLFLVGPMMLGIILLLLFLNFRTISDVLIIMGTLPFALVGGLWLMYLLGFNLSVAVAVGFIALAGLAVEIGVLMIMYLKQEVSAAEARAPGNRLSVETLTNSIRQGATRRLRPIMMTFASTAAGLAPIMYGEGTGSEVMRRIAAPMIGGIFSATVLGLVVIPVIYLLWHRRQVSAN
jgi:Cu(I)/Ag(I) efflux system membrane protein CusA/SilA